MASGLSNPCQVQCYTGGKNAVPLVLIHDATGSIFSYFLLGDLDRDVWAIFDPKHDNGLCWDGGIPEMAQQYIGLLQATGITGPVLLGGWSLGSYVAIEMARRLASGDSTANFTVAGFVIIDSPYPERQHVDLGDRHGLGKWHPPEWGKKPDLPFHVSVVETVISSLCLRPGMIVHKSVTGLWTTRHVGSHHSQSPGSQTIPIPQAVMIRCSKPAPEEPAEKLPLAVDVYRDELLLGWEGRYTDFIRAVLDIDAHHFDLFNMYDPDKLACVTATLIEGIRISELLIPANSE